MSMRKLDQSHAVQVFQYARSLINDLTVRFRGDRDLAEDLIGDVITDYVHRRIGVKDYKVWITNEVNARIKTRYKELNELKGYAVMVKTNGETADHNTPESELARVSGIEFFKKVLSGVSERDRDVFISFWIHGESIAEIQKKLNLSESHIYRIKDSITAYVKQKIKDAGDQKSVDWLFDHFNPFRRDAV